MSNLFDHNIPLYQTLVSTLQQHQIALIVSATGTGKSHLAAEYIREHDLKALIVCPTYAIMAQWAKIQDTSTLVSYSRFYRMTQQDLDDYDIYIFDEAHHSGSPVWGNAFKRLLDFTGKPIIGLTADPVRYSDKCTDVSQTLFGGNVVQGYTMAEAVEAKVLPVGTYVSALFNVEEIINNVKQNPEVTNKLVAKMEMTAANTGSITDILRRHMPAGWRKGVVFTDKIASIPEAEKLIQEAFPKANILTVHSQMSQKTVENVLALFSKMRSGFLIAVNMLNEGVHLPYVNTIIMFRRTASPSIFTQQIGRCLMPGNKNIIMFDFVGNYHSLKFTYKQRKNTSSTLRRARFDLPEQTIIHDYTQAIYDVLDEIENFLSGKWSPAEDAILLAHYPTEGTRCAHLLPGRSANAISHRAALLGLRKLPKWTPAMDKLLREYYRTNYMPLKNQLVSAGFTCNAIRNRARALGLTNPANWHVWTEADDAILRQYYPTEGSRVMNRFPGQTKGSVMSHVKLLGIKYGKFTGRWTEEEKKILRKHFHEGIDAVSALLPGRSEKAIMTKADLLGIREANLRLNYTRRCWSEDENNILRQYWPTEGSGVLSRLPNRSPESISHHAKTLGLTRPAAR